MLAMLAREPFDSKDYLFEIKWDGTRCLAFIEKGTLRLQNRRFNEIQNRFPELTSLRSLPGGTVLDGEIVVLHQGKPSFPRLQQREANSAKVKILASRLPATYMVFDLLFRKSESVMHVPLIERRDMLKKLLAPLSDPHVLTTDFLIGAGKRFFQEVEKAGMEGIMAKQLDSSYLPGKRSVFWKKIKVAGIGVFDILGYIQRKGQPFVSSLLLGEYSPKGWRYLGKVGSGLSEDTRHALFMLFKKAPPLPSPPEEAAGKGILVTSGLKARVRYMEKTAAGHLRAPVLIDLEKS